MTGFDFTAARRHMLDSQVRPNDVTDLRIQKALETTPREHFLPPDLAEQAYVEREIAYAPGRSMITARDFAKLLAALSPKPSDLALDVASGSGYSTAVLARLVETAIAVENDEALALKAQEAWTELGVDNAVSLTAQTKDGAPKQGPFDLILIAGVIEVEPETLLKQLKPGGRLGAIRRSGPVAKGVIWTRSGDAFASAALFDSSARQTLPGFERPKLFVF